MIFRKDLEDLPPYIPGRKIPGILKMASNENPLGPSPLAMEAISAAVGQLHAYPDGSSLNLRTAVAAALGLSPTRILAGNGSDEVLGLIALAYLTPGLNAVVSENTFSEYAFSVRLAGATVKKAPLHQGRYDLKALGALVDQNTRILFLCNPNNPTGTHFSHDELTALLDSLPPTVMVVLDEAYVHYADAPDFPRSVELLDLYPNLVITRTFSKIYGLAALRVGLALASEKIISEVSRVKQPFNLSSLGQVGAAAALEDRDFLHRSFEMNREGRDFLYAELSRRKIEYLPTQANFIALRVNRDAREFFDAMVKEGVTIRPLNSFGLPHWIRVTIGPADHNRTFLKALDGAWG